MGTGVPAAGCFRSGCRAEIVWGWGRAGGRERERVRGGRGREGGGAGEGTPVSSFSPEPHIHVLSLGPPIPDILMAPVLPPLLSG